MPYLIGFLIALFIALTGVGAGTLTVPVLVLFLGVPASIAVGIGLMFSAAVKLILVPAQIARGNVAWRTLGFMLLGGLPGVLLGSFVLRKLITVGAQSWLNAALGVILVFTACWQIFYSLRPSRQVRGRRDRSRLLALLMFPVGAEVGFSSAGAGALGRRSVGTTIVGGMLLSTVLNLIFIPLLYVVLSNLLSRKVHKLAPTGEAEA